MGGSEVNELNRYSITVWISGLGSYTYQAYYSSEHIARLNALQDFPNAHAVQARLA